MATTHCLHRETRIGLYSNTCAGLTCDLQQCMEVPASPHLVCRIKEGQQPLLLHRPQDAVPLLWGGVHSGGVVCAGMQQHNGALWGVLQILDHSLQCQRKISASSSPLLHPLTQRDQLYLLTGPTGRNSHDSKLPKKHFKPQIISKGSR